jgi:hypothetical protein
MTTMIMEYGIFGPGWADDPAGCRLDSSVNGTTEEKSRTS